MKGVSVLVVALVLWISTSQAQSLVEPGKATASMGRVDTSLKPPDNQAKLPLIDSTPTVFLRDVNVVYFKSPEEWMLYYKYKSRIQKVLPYVKIAKQLYTEIKQEKENSRRRVYKHYRKDVEKEMRTKFEKELKDLTTGQGEMLFKLINRETGNNSYTIIKELKGGFAAWFYQLIGKRWGYDLKENYNPEKEKLIEMIIREMGPAYNVQS